MSCLLSIATEVKEDILDCDEHVRREIGDFLLTLQANPLPQVRQEMLKNAFFVQLPCGFYVSWEIIGDPLHLVLTGDKKGITVRILGVSRVPPIAINRGRRKGNLGAK
jgi:hypothetical protein